MAKIYSKDGESLCIDAMIGRNDRISYSRVLVEVDIAKDLVTGVPIKLPNRKIRELLVICGNLPEFYNLCHVLGHSTEMCKKKEQIQGQQQGNHLNNSHTQPTLKSRDGGTHGNGTIKLRKQTVKTRRVSGHDSCLN